MVPRVRAGVGQRVPVVVQGRGRRGRGARVLWAGAEAVVTCGLVVLLLVVHQLWWTNRQARADAGERVRVLEREWDISPSVGAGASGGSRAEPTAGAGVGPGTTPGTGTGGPSTAAAPRAASPAPTPSPRGPAALAVLRIPRLGLAVPVVEGVTKRSVLDKGYVGHYPGTAGPGRVGNFALAGHRNTHGEPFRYVNRLAPGDEISVRTPVRTYLYRVDLVLRSTSPRDVGVIRPVPRSLVDPAYGYAEPGAYLTLTTCTPEFSSSHRLVVWAKLVPGG
ncbi:class E sortase [Streptomyces sp. NPDC058877]|uniref:class E sortase n=1 Tax=Streptomyces sp. NPDC058877 TaxID=3346665 RepID=UPI0036B728AC